MEERKLMLLKIIMMECVLEYEEFSNRCDSLEELVEAYLDKYKNELRKVKILLV